MPSRGQSDTSLGKLLELLNDTETSMDICVHTVACSEIANAVVAAQRRGVTVRLITNNDAIRGSDVEIMSKAGVFAVRDTSPSQQMHHKFALLDGRSLINGSFSWTQTAVLQNRENMVLSNDTALVEAFIAEFERLWQMCIQYTAKVTEV